jgi:hypothetical protein
MNNQKRPPKVNNKTLNHSICQLENITVFHFMQDGAFFNDVCTWLHDVTLGGCIEIYDIYDGPPQSPD